METEDKAKVVLLYSGGYDSTILLLDLLDRGYEVHPMFIRYQQEAVSIERGKVKYWVEKFNLPLKILNLPPISWSNSTTVGGNANTGSESKDEYIEMRNLIFLAYATSYAESIGAKVVSAGFVGQDYYSDSSPIFAKTFDLLIDSALGIQFLAPYVEMSKDSMTQYARKYLKPDMKELFTHTTTCNTPIDDSPCGKCQGCKNVAELMDKFL